MIKDGRHFNLQLHGIQTTNKVVLLSIGKFLFLNSLHIRTTHVSIMISASFEMLQDEEEREVEFLSIFFYCYIT